MEIKNFFAQDLEGNAVPGATCFVYLPGTTTLVTGLQTAAGLALSNPFSADSNALIQFKAPNGVYDLRIVSSARDYTIRIQCTDLAAIIDDVQQANETAQAAEDIVNETISGPFLFLDNAVTQSTQIPSGKNALVISPAILPGVIIEIPAGSELVTLEPGTGGGPTPGGGEANTASNVGGGAGVFLEKSGVDLQFKSLVAGENVSISSDAETITIEAGETQLGGLSIPDFSLTQATANDRIVFANTAPTGWNTKPSRMTVSFEMVSVDYFSKNPIGHMAIVLRADTDIIATAIRGQGFAIGDLSGLAQNASDLVPTGLLETFFNGQATGDNLLWGDSDGARSLGGVVDGVRYRFQIDSVLSGDGARYLRYRQWYLDTTKSVPQWFSMVDTGDVLDSNQWADLSKTGLVFLHVFDNPAQTWTVNFYNTKVIWGPPGYVAPDQTTKLSRFGANLDGDLRFRKISQRIKVNCQTLNLGQRTAVMPNTDNTAGSLLVMPSGASTSANVAVVNSSNPGTSYRIATFGMIGPDAVIETFNLNQTGTVPLKFNIGPGVTRFTLGDTYATFAPTTIPEAASYRVTGSTKRIGQGIGTYNNIYGWGGSSAASHNSTNVLNLEGFCDIGGIRNLLQAAGSTASYADRDAIEVALRPLYCMFSSLMKDLFDKKVI